MKTLKELEREKLKTENAKIATLLNSYNRVDITPETKREVLKRIKQAKKAIGNLPENVKQEIARNANLLYEGIRSALTHADFRNLYYGDFEEFIEKTSSLEETVNGYDKISNVAYNTDLQKAILYFGFTREELEELFKKGLCDQSRDIFIKFINKRYKTQIPTQKEFEEKILGDEGSDIVTKTKNKYAYKKMKLHNGDYFVDGYPQYYERELDTYYKEIIKEYESIQKRTRRK